MFMQSVHVNKAVSETRSVNVNQAVSETLIQTQCAAVLVHKCHQATDDSLDIDQNHASTHTHIPEYLFNYNVKILKSAHYYSCQH